MFEVIKNGCLNEIVVGFDSDEEFNEENNMVDTDVEIGFHLEFF